MLFKKNVKAIMLVLFSWCLINCDGNDNKNNNSSEEVFFRCKIDGVLHEFSHFINANDPPAGEVVQFVVVGAKENESPNAPTSSIDMVVPEGATTKTYEADGSGDPELDGRFVLKKLGSTTVYMGGTIESTSFTLTITSLTSWGVKGTFSGVLENMDNSGETITISEGKFAAPYH